MKRFGVPGAQILFCVCVIEWHLLSRKNIDDCLVLRILNFWLSLRQNWGHEGCSQLLMTLVPITQGRCWILVPSLPIDSTCYSKNQGLPYGGNRNDKVCLRLA